MAQFLELKSADYDEVRVTIAGAAVEKGDFDTQNDTYGFYIADGAIGDVNCLITKASNVKIVKQAGLAIDVGDAVYYDTTANEADRTSTNVLIGYCNEDAASADTHVSVNFDGRAAFEKA